MLLLPFIPRLCLICMLKSCHWIFKADCGSVECGFRPPWANFNLNEGTFFPNFSTEYIISITVILDKSSSLIPFSLYITFFWAFGF